MKHYLEKVVVKRYEHVCKYFLDNIDNVTKEEVSNKIDKLIKKCIEKERPIRPQLENLCYNTLIDLFNIPEDSFSYAFSFRTRHARAYKNIHKQYKIAELKSQVYTIQFLYNYQKIC